MSDDTGLAEALLGLEGFLVLGVAETEAEVTIRVETTATVVACDGCGLRAEAQDRMVVQYRDLAVFGRPVRLVWHKRRWCCAEPWCDARTWTETHGGFSLRCLLTNRAGEHACRQVGRNGRPVAQLAEELGVCWQTVMDAVVEHGQPLVDAPDRVGRVDKLGVDETAYLRANRTHPTRYATGIVDLDRRVVVDLIEGNTGFDLGEWLDLQPAEWLSGVSVVATDLAESYRKGLRGRLDHATRVADPFHVVRVC